MTLNAHRAVLPPRFIYLCIYCFFLLLLLLFIYFLFGLNFFQEAPLESVFFNGAAVLPAILVVAAVVATVRAMKPEVICRCEIARHFISTVTSTNYPREGIISY